VLFHSIHTTEKAIGLQFSRLNGKYPDNDLSQKTGSPEGQAGKLPRLRCLKIVCGWIYSSSSWLSRYCPAITLAKTQSCKFYTVHAALQSNS